LCKQKPLNSSDDCGILGVKRFCKLIFSFEADIQPQSEYQPNQQAAIREPVGKQP
jgi:hypothetical protein